MNKYLCIVQIIGTEEDEDQKVRNAFMTICSTDGMGDQSTYDPNLSDLEIPPHLRRKPKDIPGITREKRKPGPQPKTYRLRFYLLPPGSEIPQLSKNDPLIQEHQEQGYGYPASLYPGGKYKTAWDLYLSESEFKNTIRSLYPVLQDKEFSLFTIDQQRMPKPVPFNVQYFKHQKYTGTVFITIRD